MPIKRILVSEKFKRSFRKLPPDIQKKFIDNKNRFMINAFDTALSTHKLKGRMVNYWSFSVTYSYRTIFKLSEDNTVLFFDIGDHRIYR